MTHGRRPMLTVRDRLAPPHRAGTAAFVVFCTLLGVAVYGGGRIPTTTASGPSNESGAEARETDARKKDAALRARAAAILQVVGGHVVLWKIQHDGRLPDFARYPNWEQFLQTTDHAGLPSGGIEKTARAGIGPYLREAPVNPFNGLSNVAVVHRLVRDGDEIPGGARAAFVVSVPSGRVFVTDASGTRVLGAGIH